MKISINFIFTIFELKTIDNLDEIMKKLLLIISITIVGVCSTFGQTLQDARKMYLEGNYIEALPIFEQQFRAKPNDASINHWYAVSLYMTGGDLDIAEKCLQLASKRKVQESNMYLALIYTEWFDFDNAEKYFDLYEDHLTRKGSRTKAQKEQEEIALNRLEENRKSMRQLKRMVSHTEDVQIIDSIIVDKENFLFAYNLSFSGGRLAPFSEIFEANKTVESTVYFNEKETKMYYSQPDTTGQYGLFTMEYLIDHFGNEKKMSKDDFGLEGSMNYPFIMSDGVTVYFAAKDPESIGGYDLFVSRYNLNTDTYLKPERLNMPFNSEGNDYMMVIDEEKGVGWFASDRNMEEGKVCIYTYIPNSTVKIIQSEDNRYLANRARISSIEDTWIEGADYSKLIAAGRTKPIKKAVIHKDFEFVINDELTYYTLHDFANKTARDAYFKVVQMKSELKQIQEKLEVEREKYANGSKASKPTLSHTILGLENKERKIKKDIPILEIEVRNLEIFESGRKK